jgi:hypothetical protein
MLLATALSASATVLEDWQMSDNDGRKLTKLNNDAGTAAFDNPNPGVTVTNGHLRASYHATTYGCLSNAELTAPNLTNGVYSLEAKFTGGSAWSTRGASWTMGLSDTNGTARTDLWSIGLIRKAGNLRLQAKVDSNRTNLHYFGAPTLTKDLVVRAEVDLDTDVLDVYFTIGTNAEQSVLDSPVDDGSVDVIRLNISNHQFAPADFVDVDYITFSDAATTPSTPYEDWTGLFLLTGTSADPTADPDGDTRNNLYEYALGGDPTNAADTGHAPVLATASGGGSNWVEYVYAKRNDAAARGLDYHLELTGDLSSPAWTNNGYTVKGTGTIDGEFDAVTNQIPTASEDQQFIQLTIEKN